MTDHTKLKNALDVAETKYGEDISYSLFKHKKTGEIYSILDCAYLEKTLEIVVIYSGKDGDIFWVRPLDEFFDGRFVKLDWEEL